MHTIRLGKERGLWHVRHPLEPVHSKPGVSRKPVRSKRRVFRRPCSELPHAAPSDGWASWPSRRRAASVATTLLANGRRLLPPETAHSEEKGQTTTAGACRRTNPSPCVHTKYPHYPDKWEHPLHCPHRAFSLPRHPRRLPHVSPLPPTSPPPLPPPPPPPPHNRASYTHEKMSPGW